MTENLRAETERVLSAVSPAPRRTLEESAGRLWAWALKTSERFPPTPDVKLAMASSGAVLSGYTVVHMLGNLQVYLGRGRFDSYAHHLRTLGAPVLPRRTVLWAFRVVLLADALTHLSCAAVLTVRAQASARRAAAQPRPLPQGRRRTRWQRLKRSMRSTGTVLGLFTAFHLADLTLGTRPAASRRHEPGAAYDNLVASLRRPPVAGLYLAAMLALAAHTSQGLVQIGNDTGLSAQRGARERFELAGRLVGTGVALGNASIPVAVLLRLVR